MVERPLQMKKRVLSAVITVAIACTSMAPALTVSATPSADQSVTESRTKYEELQAKVNEINEKVQAIDAQINPLAIKINDNKTEIENINKEIETINKEIEQAKLDVKEKEDVLGQRLRELYKTGGQSNYLSIIFEADGFRDLVTKIESAGRLINIDKKMVKEVEDNKNKLDEKVALLETKAKQIETLNEEINTQKVELDAKRAEQQVLVDQANAEQEAFDKEYLTPSERELVQASINEATNTSSSADTIKNKISYLTAVKEQLKSAVVIEEVEAAIKKANNLLSQKNSASIANSGTVSGSASALLNYAYKFIGLPYVWGATGPNSFDCSGFTSYVYKNSAGVNIGRTTYDQIKMGKAVSQSELQPGDLVFPHTGHVGIYVGNGKMIHAPQTGDVIKIGNVYKFYTARRILG